MRIWGKIGAGLIGVVLILVGTGAPVSAAGPTRLTLSKATGETGRPVQWRATLRCQPAGGTHRQARAACAELTKVNGDFAALNVVPDRYCILLYAPITVVASGYWRGRWVTYRHTFGNSCALDNATGPVFALPRAT